jgi:hypothetical protein
MKLTIGLLGLGLLIAAASQLKTELVASYVPTDGNQSSFTDGEDVGVAFGDIIKLVLWMSVVAVSFFVIIQALTS